MSDKLINVGDTLITKTFMGETVFTITRVTKTLAMAKRPRDGFEYRFKRFISANMSHPYSQYNLVSYRVERGGKS